MAAIVNTRDLRLQATTPRVEAVTLAPNITVPTVQVDGLPALITNSKGVYMQASSEVFQIAKNGTPSPATVSLTATLRNMATAPVWSVSSGTATLATNPDGSRTLSFANMTTDSVTVTVSSVENNVTYSDSITVVKLREGTDTVNMILSNEAHNIAADSLGTAGSYTGAGTSATVYVGATDTTSLWTITKVDSTGVTSSIANNQVTVTNMTASTAAGYIDITAARVGFTSITKRMSLTKTNAGTSGTNGTRGSDGSRGTVNIAVSGTWSDAGATSAISSAGYGSPQNRDIVTMYTASSSTSKFYSGGSWLTLDSYINGNMLVSGTLSCAKLAADTMIGQTYKTASSGQRVTINESGSNSVQIYDASGTWSGQFGGGGAGVVYCTAGFSIPALYATSSSGALAISCGGNLLVTGNATINGGVETGTILPRASSGYSLGSSGVPWSNIYSSTAVTVTSDIRTKENIQDSDLGLDFLMKLRPISYTIIDGHNEYVRDDDAVGPFMPGQFPEKLVSRRGIRKHYGLPAQNVKEALGDNDGAMWCLSDQNDPDSRQALRYEEFISPMIRAIQELKAIVDEQASIIKGLTGG